MHVYCDYQIDQSSTTGMLFSRHNMFGRHDRSLLLPGICFRSLFWFSRSSSIICTYFQCYRLHFMSTNVIVALQVKNTGSWMEIGNSISHFGIMSAQVVFVLLLFAITSLYTKDIRTRSSKRLSRKQV